MKISIIVPVYNVRNTLRRCVDSILAQGLDDFELLLIDDGSTDGSGAMADGIAAADSRIHAFHKPNGGLSDARNYGISRSSAAYITFADSDDEIAPGTLSALAAIIAGHPEYDILEYPVLQRPGLAGECLFNPGVNEYHDPLGWLSAFGLEHCWAWNKIYKRKLFDTVRFPVGKIYEDVYATAALLKLRPLIATTDKGMYIYHTNENGIAAHAVRRGLTPLLEAQISLVRELGIDTAERRWHRLYLNMLTSQLHSYRKTGRLTLWPQRIAVRKYVRTSDCIKALMLNTLGLRLSCRIFKLLSGK